MAKRIIYSISAILFCFVLLMTPAQASLQSTPRTVRVAFPIQAGLTEKDDQGRYSGYTYEYLQEIAQYTGWEYEFVEIPGSLNDSLMKMLEMLESGEVDVSGGFLKNEQTEQLYGFPEYSYGYSYTALFLPVENTRINEANFYEVKGLRIAVLEKAVKTKAKLEAYCKLNNISYEFVECETALEMTNSVRDGSADVFVGSSLESEPGMRIIAQFDGVQFYLATTKGRTDILQALDRSILSIKQAKPYFETQLFDKYFSNQPSKLYFTAEELNYITTAEPIRVILPQNEPIQAFRDAEEPWGISVDVFRRIESMTGLKFVFISAPSYASALEMLDAGQGDIICGIPYEYRLAQDHGLLMSDPFLSAQGVMITRKEQPSGASWERVAILDRKSLDLYQENLTLLPYDNVTQCLDAVVSGEADSAYLSLYAAEYLGRYTQYKNLQLVPQSGSTVVFCAGVKKNSHAIVLSVLNKALRNLPNDEMETIVYQNMNMQNGQITLQAFIAENPFVSLGISTAFFLILILIIVSILRLRVRASRLIKVENQRYQRLYELANEYIYEYDCQRDTLTLSKNFANLFGLPEIITHFRRKQKHTASQGEPQTSILLELLRGLGHGLASGDEVQPRLPGGEARWYRNTFTQIDDSQGQALYFIGKLTDIQDEVTEREALEQKVQMDGLTGIYNAASVKHMIGQRLAQLRGQGALLILDIDHFKDVNDMLGHYIGDTALCDLSNLMADTIGEQDILGRLGGDEFIIYLDGLEGQEQAKSFCRTLCQRARRVYTDESGKSCTVTISIGAALVQHSCTFTELYQAADRLLYAAKDAGRNQFTLAVL